jgi:hypothetical protein
VCRGEFEQILAAGVGDALPEQLVGGVAGERVDGEDELAVELERFATGRDDGDIRAALQQAFDDACRFADEVLAVVEH